MPANNKLIASVIIPTKNGGHLFEKVIESLYQQELYEDSSFEIVLVDSGSSDGTVEFIKKEQERQHNILLKEISPTEFGHGKTRNLGASLARGKYLVFITQDALPYDQHWLQNLISVFDLDPEIMGVFGKHIPYEDCDLFEQMSLTKQFNNFGSEVKVYYLEDRARYLQDEGYKHLLCFYSDNCSAMRKSIWETIPYPDVDFAEDQLWAKEIIEKGYKKAYTPFSIVYHSHRYPFKQQFKRYFDEYRGLNKIYDYVPVRWWYLIPAYTIRHLVTDIKYLSQLSSLSVFDKLKWSVYSFTKNIIRYTAAYLGVKGNKYPYLIELFSRI